MYVVKFYRGDSPKPMLKGDGFIHIRSALTLTIKPNENVSYDTNVTCSKPLVNVDTGEIIAVDKPIRVTIEGGPNGQFIEIGDTVARVVALSHHGHVDNDISVE